MSKRANPMAVRASLTYTVEEAAAVLGVSKATIRNWVKDGLPVMNSRKPMLILGVAIRKYLKEKSSAAKYKLAWNELYCLSCRTGRRPLDMTVTPLPNTGKTTRLMGICEKCEASASRIVSNTNMLQLSSTFNFEKSGSSVAYPKYDKPNRQGG